MKPARNTPNESAAAEDEGSPRRKRATTARCLCGDQTAHIDSEFEHEIGGLNMLADAVLADVEVGFNAEEDEWVPKGQRRKPNTSSKETSKNLVPVQGRRLIDLACFFDALKPVLVCNCGKARMHLKEDINRLNYLYSALYLVCEACNRQIYLPTSRPVEIAGKKMWEVNNRTKILQNDHRIDEDTLCTVFWVYDLPYVKGGGFMELEDDHVFEDTDLRNLECYPECQDYIDVDDVADEVEIEGKRCVTDDKSESDEKPSPSSTKSTEESGSSTEPKSAQDESDTEDKEKFVCMVCNQVFTYLLALQHHTKIHIEDQPFQCSKCQETFVLQEQLKEHSKIHRINGPVECKDCGLVFKNMNVRGRHITQCHPHTRHECPQCGRFFSKPDHLVQHIRIHTGEKPYVCSICNKRFRQPSTLQKHGLLVHSNDRPLKCQLCDRRFVLVQHLRQHEKTHTREKRRSKNKRKSHHHHHDNAAALYQVKQKTTEEPIGSPKRKY